MRLICVTTNCDSRSIREKLSLVDRPRCRTRTRSPFRHSTATGLARGSGVPAQRLPATRLISLKTSRFRCSEHLVAGAFPRQAIGRSVRWMARCDCTTKPRFRQNRRKQCRSRSAAASSAAPSAPAHSPKAPRADKHGNGPGCGPRCPAAAPSTRTPPQPHRVDVIMPSMPSVCRRRRSVDAVDGSARSTAGRRLVIDLKAEYGSSNRDTASIATEAFAGATAADRPGALAWRSAHRRRADGNPPFAAQPYPFGNGANNPINKQPRSAAEWSAE